MQLQTYRIGFFPGSCTWGLRKRYEPRQPSRQSRSAKSPPELPAVPGRVVCRPRQSCLPSCYWRPHHQSRSPISPRQGRPLRGSFSLESSTKLFLEWPESPSQAATVVHQLPARVVRQLPASHARVIRRPRQGRPPSPPRSPPSPGQSRQPSPPVPESPAVPARVVRQVAASRPPCPPVVRRPRQRRPPSPLQSRRPSRVARRPRTLSPRQSRPPSPGQVPAEVFCTEEHSPEHMHCCHLDDLKFLRFWA